MFSLFQQPRFPPHSLDHHRPSKDPGCFTNQTLRDRLSVTSLIRAACLTAAASFVPGCSQTNNWLPPLSRTAQQTQLVADIRRAPMTATEFHATVMQASITRTPGGTASTSSALPLLMARVGAYHEHHAAAANDLTILANAFDAGTNFHGLSLLSFSSPSTVRRCPYSMRLCSRPDASTPCCTTTYADAG